METGHCVCLEVVSFLSSFCPCKKTLEKAKKLFKVSLLSLLKDSLVNCFWENLSFCQIVFGTDTFQKLTLGVPERLLGTVCVLVDVLFDSRISCT